jgi:hypothetical protein
MPARPLDVRPPARPEIRVQRWVRPSIERRLDAGQHRKRTVSVALGILMMIPVGAVGQLDVSPLYELGALSHPEEEVFGEFPALWLSTAGELLVGDHSFGEVRMFRADGRFAWSFGRPGQGPGEFQWVSSVTLNPVEDSVYVLDATNHRVTVLTPTGHLVRDFRPGMEGYFWQLRVHPEGYLLFVGERAGDGLELVHITNLAGEHVRSIAPLLRTGDLGPFVQNPLVREQLNQGAIEFLPDGDVLVMLASPFRIARVSLGGDVRWTVEDSEIHPNPLTYFDVSADAYSVGFYPRAVSIHQLSEDRFLVRHEDYEDEVRAFDVRDLRTGALLSRTTVPTDAYHAPALVLATSKGLGVIASNDPFPRFLVVRWEWPSP